MEITATKLKSVSLEVKDNGEVGASGTYEMISNKGKVVAVQSFNGYGNMKIEFDKPTLKNFVSDIEGAIDLEIGINEAVKKAGKL